MSTMKTLIRTTAVLVGSSAALLLGGIAHADPGQPVTPGAQTPNVVDQLVSTVANAPQMLQNLGSALGATPPAPATPPPLASAAIKMPQAPTAAAQPTATGPVATAVIPGLTPPAAPGSTATAPATGLPGMTTTVPAASGFPGISSALPGSTTAAPATGPAALAPTANLNVPDLPFLPVPLPQQLSLPNDLASLATGGVPGARPAPAPSPVAGPVTPGGTLFPPFATLP